MPPSALPKSFRRKYKKLHAQFSAVHASTVVLEEDLNAITATALKLISENDMLLDLLSEISSEKSPQSVAEQLWGNIDSSDDEAAAHQVAYGGVTQDGTAVDSPEYFQSLPWDLDRLSHSGSYLEDVANSIEASNTSQLTAQAETPISNAVARRMNAKQPSGKKRERLDGEEDINGTGNRKKKRKSSNLQHFESFET